MLSKDGFWCELRCAVAHTCSVVPESSLTPSGVSRGALRACYSRGTELHVIAIFVGAKCRKACLHVSMIFWRYHLLGFY